MAKTRSEKDSMGTLQVPANAYYGASTQRSVHNFQISGRKWHPELIEAIALLKISCAKANYELGFLDKKKTVAIVKAATEVVSGKLHDEFPLDQYQAGSGTSTNMNVNEVIANRATELAGGKKGSKLIHPNDDVNKGQSTNNIIPSAMRVAAALMVPGLRQNVVGLQKSCAKKGKQFSKILKSGRTHLQDAVPIRLGQVFDAYAAALSKHIRRLDESLYYLTALGVGGTAVGTGLNTHPQFRKTILKHLNSLVPVKFSVTKNGIESTQFLTDMAGLMSTLKILAIDLNKISNDLRLMSSGPKTGLNEINLPPAEPGSSIMPGKINPSIAEAMNMVCHTVFGHDTSMTHACTTGNLELNTHMPMIAHGCVESLELLTNAVSMLDKQCVSGITANKEQCEWYVEHSMALATALNPYLGYDVVAGLVKEAKSSGKPIKEIIVAKGIMDKKRLDQLLDPHVLTKPNLSRPKKK